MNSLEPTTAATWPCLVGGGEPDVAGVDHSPVSTKLDGGGFIIIGSYTVYHSISQSAIFQKYQFSL